ncbi:AvrPphF family type III effector, partial [Escherichia coli]
MMALFGIHPDIWLVRITLPDYVDLKNMRISGHSHTVAKIEEPYDLKPHSLISGLKLPRTKPFQNLGLECLNVMYTN